MPRLEVRPHLVATADRVTAADWVFQENGQRVTDDPIAGWDPTMPLRLTRPLLVDGPGIRHDCGLARDDPLLIACVWLSPGTTLRGAGSAAQVPESDVAAVDLEVTIPGELVADRVMLASQVILADSVRPSTPLAPTIAGSILWQEETSVLLEGRGSRFPAEWVDFTTSGWLPSNGGWFLDWSPDEPDLPALAGIRLYLNTANAAVREAVATASPDLRHLAIRSAIRYDVACTLVTRSLESDAFTSDWDEHAAESVGGVVQRLIATLLPTESPAGLRNEARDHRDRLEAKLQSALNLFNERDGL
jgi:hypothetical protein